MTQVKFINAVAPDTPVAGSVIIYSKTDKKLYLKDEDGLETAL